MAPLRFLFDYISHNAYMAWTQIFALAEGHGRQVEPVPVLFAGLLNANGQRGPAEIPGKAAWMARDVLRKAALLGVPLAPPKTHPFNPLLSLRASGLPLADDARRRLIDGLFRAVWFEQRDVSDAATVADVARAAGLDGAAIVEAAGGAEAKARLRRDTDEAIAAGVFGVPTVLVDGQLFWGYDDLPMLERFLGGRDPLDLAELARWSRIRPSARRRRPEER